MISFLKSFKNYANFEGRACRKEYWYFVLFLTLFEIFFMYIGLLIHFEDLFYIIVLSTLIPCIAVSIRRMHDVNKSGWYILIPIYNLILYFTAGTDGPNQYGSDPKRPEFEEFLK